MAGAIWVLAEQWRGALSEVTFELLALGRELADGLGVPLEAVQLGSSAEALAGSLGTADRVLYADAPALAEPIGELGSEALAALAAERKPAPILVPITNVSWDLVGLLPARLGARAGELLHRHQGGGRGPGGALSRVRGFWCEPAAGPRQRWCRGHGASGFRCSSVHG